MAEIITLSAPVAAVVLSIDVEEKQPVSAGQLIIVLESMKVHTPIVAECAGRVNKLLVQSGDVVQEGAALCEIDASAAPVDQDQTLKPAFTGDADALEHFRERVAITLDSGRPDSIKSRHQKGLRTARENLADLLDPGSFVEYGQLAVAAQRNRRDYDELKSKTAADGIITGVGNINAALFGDPASAVAVAINDYTVLAGTQGYFHHRKLDRIMQVAAIQKLPLIMYTEGGGGRPGDTDVLVSNAWMDMSTVTVWGALSTIVPRIAVNNGYCFAGNAALFGGADISIATRQSWIGMAGPAMIEGGGLGRHEATSIGPAELQATIGGLDVLVENEAEATAMAKKVLGYFQGALPTWRCADQDQLWQLMPKDRRVTYDIRKLIQRLVDEDSFVELQKAHAKSIVIGFVRIEGQPFGLLANDCRVLGGAIDAEAALKTARFVDICDSFGIPLLSLCDTPGFMVGPESENQGAVRKMSTMLTAVARVKTPLVTIFLRRGYGMGAMAMAGGCFRKPIYAAAWPTGEFGGMGLEGAVYLGFKKELDAAENAEARNALFNRLVTQAYDKGKATETASYLEIDAVIEPKDTRRQIIQAIKTRKPMNPLA